MMRQGFAVAATLLLGLITLQAAHAGTLATHVAALPGWAGTVAYDNGNNLSGTIDYAVFTASDFNANFGALGYTPGDAYIYTYQVLNAGSDNFSQLTVGITNPANTIGSFNIGAVDASSALFDGSGNAEFQFVGTPVATGQSSYGLAFSAPTVPMQFGGIISDGGGSLQIALPSPSAVPEPASACLAALACGAAAASVRRGRSDNRS